MGSQAVKNIKNLKQKMDTFYIKHIYKEANKLADGLAANIRVFSYEEV